VNLWNFGTLEVVISNNYFTSLILLHLLNWN